MDTKQLEPVVGKVPINPKGGSWVHDEDAAEDAGDDDDSTEDT